MYPKDKRTSTEESTDVIIICDGIRVEKAEKKELRVIVVSVPSGHIDEWPRDKILDVMSYRIYPAIRRSFCPSRMISNN